MLSRLKSWQVVFFQTVWLTAVGLFLGFSFTVISTADFARAGDLTYISATLSDTRFASTTNLTLQFDLATTLSKRNCSLDPCGAVDLIFPWDATNSRPYFRILDDTIPYSDLDVYTTSTGSLTIDYAFATTSNDHSTSSYKDMLRIPFALKEYSITTGSTMTVEVNGQHIENPSRQSGISGDGFFEAYALIIATNVSTTAAGYQAIDTGSTKAATHEGVHVHVGVSDSFTFTVAGIPNDGSFKWGGTETPTVGSTSTSCPFGTLNPARPKTCGQTLTVNTNATNGYVIFVQQDHDLQSGSNDIDQFKNGTAVICDAINASTTSCAAQALDWSTPLAQKSNENTWGHLGYSSDNIDVFPSHTKYAAIGNESSALTQSSPIMANNVGTGVDEVVHSKFKVEISALQEAGDYTNNVWYVAEPRY